MVTTGSDRGNECGEPEADPLNQGIDAGQRDDRHGTPQQTFGDHILPDAPTRLGRNGSKRFGRTHAVDAASSKM